MGPKNKIEDLRNHLFDVIERLKDNDPNADPKDIISVEKALAIKEVAQVIVSSAKVEVDFMRLTNGHGSGFIPVDSVLNSNDGAAESNNRQISK